jgi:hypothetical protein
MMVGRRDNRNPEAEMKPSLGIATVFASCLLTACTVAEPAGNIRLGPDPVLSGGSYSSGGGLTLAVEAREQAGHTLVCGVWAQSRQQAVMTRGVAPKVLGTGSVYMGDEAAVRGLTFMREVPPAADYGGLEAPCVLSERRWQPGDETRRAVIRIPRQIVVEDRDVDGGLGTGLAIKFRQTGPSAGGGA